MKSFIATAALATVATAKVNSDFMSGFQSGAFLGDFDEFEDYSCPLPAVGGKI